MCEKTEVISSIGQHASPTERSVACYIWLDQCLSIGYWMHLLKMHWQYQVVNWSKYLYYC